MENDDIVQSWHANAGNWIKTIDDGLLESRLLVTNQAMVDAVLACHPVKVLDVGCGEGWLTRALSERGVQAFGVDAVEALVANAIAKHGPHYAVASYRQLLTEQQHLIHAHDVFVFNFCLLDRDDTDAVLHGIGQQATPGARVVIQTLHPIAVAAQGPYITGWRDGSWNGLPADYLLPYQWYFRTLQAWMELFAAAGLQVVHISEPLHPTTQQPASVIFTLRVNGSR